MGLQAGPISALSNEARSKEHLESWGIIARGALPTLISPTLISKGTSSAASSTNPLALHPGCIISLEGPTGLGLTRVGLSMIAEASQHAPVVVVDVRGWICPLAAWEAGVRADRLVVIRCDDIIQWPSAIAALLEGVKAVFAEVPTGVPEAVLRRLGALARSKDAALVLRPLKGKLPSGIAYLRVQAGKVVWTGAHDGHGRLEGRKIMLELSGKGASGNRQLVEVEDDGSHALRVVSRLAAETARRAAG